MPLAYRVVEMPAENVPAGEGVRDARTALVEAALFAADEPLPLRKLVKAANLSDAAEVRKVIHKLREFYDLTGSAFQIEEVAGGFQLLTRPEYHRWLVRLRNPAQEIKLSNAAKETLTIVAYRQPIMRADVEAIRGVQCGDTLRLLMEKGLIRITGRDDSLGRPVLYGTTRKFLEIHGYKSLKDLPPRE
jgi:segregation and condensation protein B